MVYTGFVYFQTEVSPNRTSSSAADKFTIGQSNNIGSGNLFGAATYDEMEFWYASRDYLLAFDYIQRGKLFSMFRLLTCMKYVNLRLSFVAIIIHINLIQCPVQRKWKVSIPGCHNTKQSGLQNQ